MAAQVATSSRPPNGPAGPPGRSRKGDPTIELVPHGVAHGGEAVARSHGKTFFVAGAMPGERLVGEIVLDKGAWARVALGSLVTTSPARVEPPCPHFGVCGGCQWQFARYAEQLEWKQVIVAGQLAHLGGLEDAVVRPTVSPGPEYGYRNRMDFRVVDGKPALFRSRSKELVPLTVCLLLHPSLEDLFARLGPLVDTHRITLRTGVNTGDLMVVVTGAVPSQAGDWGASVVRSHRHRLDVVFGDRSITELVDGHRFRITAASFFQNNTSGAEALVALAGEAADLGGDDVLLDAYAGTGLFAVTMGGSAARVIAVEVSGTSVGDLRRNLASAGVDRARVVRGAFEEVADKLDDYWTVAVVDPPRTGLGAGGVAAVTATFPRTVVYVSCDPASLARDARLLAAAGYRLDWAAPVDMFPQTYHVETVARFTTDPAS